MLLPLQLNAHFSAILIQPVLFIRKIRNADNKIEFCIQIDIRNKKPNDFLCFTLVYLPMLISSSVLYLLKQLNRICTSFFSSHIFELQIKCTCTWFKLDFPISNSNRYWIDSIWAKKVIKIDKLQGLRDMH